VQSNNYVVVAGDSYTTLPGNTDLNLVRFTSSGTLDSGPSAATPLGMATANDGTPQGNGSQGTALMSASTSGAALQSSGGQDLLSRQTNRPVVGADTARQAQGGVSHDDPDAGEAADLLGSLLALWVRGGLPL
jgi:hypothetical protein